MNPIRDFTRRLFDGAGVRPKDPAKILLEKLEQEKLRVEIRKLTAEAEQQEIFALSARETEQLSVSKSRLIHFNDSVYGDSVSICMDHLRRYTALDPTKKIEILLNSGGGGVFDGLELYDHIMSLRKSGTPINITALGVSASMAGILLQAGEVRRMGPSAHLMIHEVASGSIGKVSKIKDEVKLAERLYDRLITILVERSAACNPIEPLSFDQIKDRADRKDWWLSADEALRHGFIDEVLSAPLLAI